MANEGNPLSSSDKLTGTYFFLGPMLGVEACSMAACALLGTALSKSSLAESWKIVNFSEVVHLEKIRTKQVDQNDAAW